MSKVKRHVLTLDHTVDFEMIGICSHHSDYRLVWGLNQLLHLHLAKADDFFVIHSKKGLVQSQHSYYFWSDEENHMEYYLIKNKNEGKFLIPEKNQIDYFLFLRDNVFYELDEILEKVKKVTSIMAAYIIDTDETPSAEQILF
uniref:IPExxxVDY family protein n=1 Tax=Fluviicola sp. TaxID=1917219 RepID=UPI00404AB630